jgi:hypothetical protein
MNIKKLESCIDDNGCIYIEVRIYKYCAIYCIYKYAIERIVYTYTGKLYS